MNPTPSRLAGLIAAPFTAMNADGSLNLSTIERQAKLLAQNNVSGAFICGTTGEGMSLSVAERLQIAEKWVSVAPLSLSVIVHVGHQTVADSCALAAHAQKIGAYAFATIAPTFFRVSNLEQLVDYCAQVAASAPKLPFFYYHMPAMAGADLPMIDFLKLAGKRIPNLAGIKFTHENLMDYARCLNFEGGKYNILFGRDEILLAALAMGAKGAVGSTYNYMAPLYNRVIEAFEAGDQETAQRYQTQAIEIIAIMSRAGGLPMGKAMMKMIGIDCGPVRPPLPNPSTEAVETMAEKLKAVGFPLVEHRTTHQSKPALAATAAV